MSLTFKERFGNMTRVYYKEARGAFIVFDVTRAESFEAVSKWKLDLDTKVLLPDGKPIPCILLGKHFSKIIRGKTLEFCRFNAGQMSIHEKNRKCG